MLFPSLLLLLAFTSVMADIEDEIEQCTSMVDIEELQRVSDLPDVDEVEEICPPMLSFFDCIEGVIEDATGLTVEEIGAFMEGTEEGRFITVYVNLRNLLKELCDKDSQLYKEYQESSSCYKTIDTSGIAEQCEREADAAYETFKSMEDEVQEEAGEDSRDDNKVCMIEAYKAACMGAKVHEQCGKQAFDTYMVIMRRSSLFKYGICTEGQMSVVKNRFYDSLEMNSSDKDIFRLALELKKRRK